MNNFIVLTCAVDSLTIPLKSCQSPKFISISFFSSSRLQWVRTRPFMFACGSDEQLSESRAEEDRRNDGETAGGAYLHDGRRVPRQHAGVHPVDSLEPLAHRVRPQRAERHRGTHLQRTEPGDQCGWRSLRKLLRQSVMRTQSERPLSHASNQIPAPVTSSLRINTSRKEFSLRSISVFLLPTAQPAY